MSIDIMDSRRRLVKGFATVDVKDYQADRIPIEVMKGAFLEYMSRGGAILFRHKGKIVGKVLHWNPEFNKEAGKEGIQIIAEINKQYKFDDLTWNAVKEGAIKGFSVGGDIPDPEQNVIMKDGGVQEVQKVELGEISLVVDPANPYATIEETSIAKEIQAGDFDSVEAEIREPSEDIKRLQDLYGKDRADKIVEVIGEEDASRLLKAKEMTKKKTSDFNCEDCGKVGNWSEGKCPYCGSYKIGYSSKYRNDEDTEERKRKLTKERDKMEDMKSITKAYTDRDFKSKKELKDAIARGEKIRVYQPNSDLFGGSADPPQNGKVYLEGPHYPKPHTWYGEAWLENGIIVKVKELSPEVEKSLTEEEMKYDAEYKKHPRKSPTDRNADPDAKGLSFKKMMKGFDEALETMKSLNEVVKVKGALETFEKEVREIQKEMRKTDNEQCQRCLGNGWVYAEGMDRARDTSSRIRCPDCKGTGIEKEMAKGAEECAKLGHKYPDGGKPGETCVRCGKKYGGGVENELAKGKYTPEENAYAASKSLIARGLTGKEIVDYLVTGGISRADALKGYTRAWSEKPSTEKELRKASAPSMGSMMRMGMETVTKFRCPNCGEGPVEGDEAGNFHCKACGKKVGVDEYRQATDY